MSLLIGDKVVVSMHYKLTNNAGDILDSSEGEQPLSYLHGAGNLIPGLEKELTGKTVGASLQVAVAPEEAYGPVNDALIETVPRSAFQGVESVEPGMAFEARGNDGQSRRIVVTEISGDDITVDGNHPLAGVELNFDVEIIEVRDATEEEIAHGHVH
jgi:FKBP-type peptidyl-prolyl cis-trans isomerase SlyD